MLHPHSLPMHLQVDTLHLPCRARAYHHRNNSLLCKVSSTHPLTHHLPTFTYRALSTHTRCMRTTLIERRPVVTESLYGPCPQPAAAARRSQQARGERRCPLCPPPAARPADGRVWGAHVRHGAAPHQLQTSTAAAAAEQQHGGPVPAAAAAATCECWPLPAAATPRPAVQIRIRRPG